MIRLLEIVRLLDAPLISHRPHLVSWIHRFCTEDPLPSTPWKPLSGLPSLRSVTSPKMAKPDSLMLPVAPPLLKMLLPCNVVYHWPAPVMVTWSTCSADGISNRPDGIHTDLPCDLAAEMALRKACVSSEVSSAVAP